MMRIKPDKKIGLHGLPLKGYAIDTPITPDTTAVSVELLFYIKKQRHGKNVYNHFLTIVGRNLAALNLTALFFKGVTSHC